MRAPLSWLREYAPGLPADAGAEQVAADLVRVGLEEEALHGGDVTGPVVVGRVLEFTDERQKNGKTIRWCSVDVGSHGVPDGSGGSGGSGDSGGSGGFGPRGIVCGADNFRPGDLVVVCLPGAVLPGGFAIAARKTYGHVSDGMICAADELGLGEDHFGIIRLAEWGLDAAPGDDAIRLLGLDEQTVEVNVTPDRGYCFSLRGIAREYSHATGTPFADPAPVVDALPAPTADGFAVRIADDAPIRGTAGCGRYVARVVRGVSASAPSPRWMRRRLEQAGMRPISLAVDVTNYVMLALGQPLHAFDLSGLVAPVVVRRARAGETLVTLDDVKRDLDPEDLLITDSDGQRVLALAGVMGGASSEVGPDTTDLLIEAATFDWVTVARTARRHKLVTEAGRRFERGVDVDLAASAAELAVRLLVEHGGGSIGAVTDIDQRVAREPIRMPADLPTRVVGCQWTRDEVVNTLVTIGCEVRDADGLGDGRDATQGPDLMITVPSWRPDLRIGVDLVEEVARLRGYHQIPSVLPMAPAGRGLTHGQRIRRSVARALAEHGLVEVLSYPFVATGVHDAFGLSADDPRRRAVRLANPLSDEQPELRTSILPPLLDTLRRNVGRGLTDLGLFEIGLVVRPDQPLDVAPPAPRPAATRRPDPDQLRALLAAVPPQPRRVGIVLTGWREQPGWSSAGRQVDWADAVEAARVVAEAVGVRLHVDPAELAPWHPGRCAKLTLDQSVPTGSDGIGGVDEVVVGYAGELHPKVVAALGLPPRTCVAEIDLDVLVEASGGIRRAAPVSTHPVAKEDVALIVDDAVPSARVEQALRLGAGPLLESVRLFDVYTGPQVGAGRKSLAFALRLRASDRTLTAAEAAAARQAAVARAEAEVGAVLRGV